MRASVLGILEPAVDNEEHRGEGDNEDGHAREKGLARHQALHIMAMRPSPPGACGPQNPTPHAEPHRPAHTKQPGQ